MFKIKNENFTITELIHLRQFVNENITKYEKLKDSYTVKELKELKTKLTDMIFDIKNQK